MPQCGKQNIEKMQIYHDNNNKKINAYHTVNL